MELTTDTRTAIVAAARELMFEKGFDATTMRAIADKAGVSLGNAYYYFAGKDELIQGFYEEIATAHQARVREAVRGKRGFGDRLTTSLLILVDLADEYAPVADALLTRGIQPTGTLNPFSAQSSRPRSLFLETCTDLVEGSKLRTDADLRAALPELQWLVHLAVTLGWVQDLSEGKVATRRSVARLGPTLGRLVSMAKVPALRPFVKMALDQLADLHVARPGWVQQS
jgi:AcrR family transcriptional regulator